MLTLGLSRVLKRCSTNSIAISNTLNRTCVAIGDPMLSMHPVRFIQSQHNRGRQQPNYDSWSEDEEQDLSKYEGQGERNYGRGRFEGDQWGQDYVDPRNEVKGYTSNSQSIQTVTYEDLDCDDLSLEDMSENIREKLDGHGVTELFPVQKATYKLFLDGRQLIVK